MRKFSLKMNLFNTSLILTVESYEGYEEDFKYIRYVAGLLQNSFNIYNPNSEISKLNNDKQIKPSIYLRDILEKVKKYEKLTDYYFNTNQTFSIGEHIEFIGEIVKVKDQVDLGAIAKGYFMQIIKQHLESKDVKYELDFGGALLFKEDKSIKIRDMNDAFENVLQIILPKDNTIHTSSFYWQTDGENTHIHTKDSGYKVLSKSVSVIDENPILADVFATALYCMDIEVAQKYIQKYNLKVIYVIEQEVYVSNGLKVELLKANYSLKRI